MIFVKLLIITCLITWIIDLTDLIPTIKKWIWNFVWKNHNYKEFSMKPLDCSTCSVWWIGILYLLIVGEFNIIMIGYVGLLSFSTGIIRDILTMFEDMIKKLIDLIYKILKL